MGAHAEAAELRSRASRLRRLAEEIERSSVMDLDRAAGPATWQMPKAAMCEALLARNVQQLHHAADELRCTAMRLLRRADELDVQLVAGRLA